MKTLTTILITLFALVVNAQDRDTFTICNNVKIHTEYNSHSREVTLRSDLNFLDESDLIHKVRAIDNVIATASNPYKMDILMSVTFIPEIFTESLLDTLSMYWCNQLFERTPTGLKQDTIYDYGTRTPKEVDSLEKVGHVVIRTSMDTSYILFSTKHYYYDTLEVEGLALYLSNDDFEKGKVFELLPTVKTIVKERPNYWNSRLQVNSYKITFDKAVKVIQLSEVEGAIWWNGVKPREWQEVDLTKYKEFIFIEKPK